MFRPLRRGPFAPVHAFGQFPAMHAIHLSAHMVKVKIRFTHSSKGKLGNSPVEACPTRSRRVQQRFHSRPCRPNETLGVRQSFYFRIVLFRSIPPVFRHVLLRYRNHLEDQARIWPNFRNTCLILMRCLQLFCVAL